MQKKKRCDSSTGSSVCVCVCGGGGMLLCVRAYVCPYFLLSLNREEATKYQMLCRLLLFKNVSHLAALLQHSGWWSSAGWEEGLRPVWVCLGDEHSHRVLLPQSGARCVSSSSPILCIWSRCPYSTGPVCTMFYCCSCVLLSVKSPCLCLRVPPGCHSLSSVASLESPVICCLGPLIQYLREFNLERVLRSERYAAQRKCTHLVRQGFLPLGQAKRRWLEERAG